MNDLEQPSLLVISTQEMKRGGNQVLQYTIKRYLANGFKVTFITKFREGDFLQNDDEFFSELGQNLTTIRFHIPFNEIRHRLIGKGWTKKIYNILKNEMQINSETNKTLISPEEIVPFVSQRSFLLSWLQHKLFNIHTLKEVNRLTKYHKVDLVYGFEAGATEIAWKVSRLLSVPLCTRYQGTFLTPLLNDEPFITKRYSFILRGTKVSSDLYIMSNDGTRGKEVLLKLGHPSENILFLLDGIQKDIYRPKINSYKVWKSYGVPISKKTYIILTLSKLIGWKRHDRIIGAMPAILREIPDAYLVIAHGGYMRPILEKYARDLGVANRVIFIGKVLHDQVYRLLNTCDVYVNCNDHSNLSNTVLEALECGRPVVSIDDGSLDDVIKNGENGLLVDRINIRKEFPEQIIKLLKDSQLWSKISINARTYAEQNLLSWEERMRIEVDRVKKLINY